MILSLILVRSFEKSVPLNLINLILKFGDVWITYSRSLDFWDNMVCFFFIEIDVNL